MIKKFCPTHCLYYTGAECPMCAQERIASLEKRFVKNTEKIEVKKVKKNDEITKASLEALVAKFNKR